MKLRNVLLVLPFLTFTLVYCSHNENNSRPVQAYLESNIIFNTPEQKQDLCESAFDHVWKKINGTKNNKQAILYSICKHAYKNQHDINPETAQSFFDTLKPRLIDRLNRDAIKLQTEDQSQSESIPFSRSEKRTKNIAFCCYFFHQKLATPVDFDFDNPNFFSNKESYDELLQQFQATAIKADK